MTGSVAIDIAIGLIFIYLIYSLLASTLQEIIATILGSRAKNLKHAIRRMLEDEAEDPKNIFERLFARIKGWLQPSSKAKGDSFLSEFYNQPIIKYLASGKMFSKPSYMNESDFANAILDILKKQGGTEGTNIEKIETAIKNSEIISDETKAHLQSLLDNAENDLEKFKTNLEGWFNNTMERAAGWYKRNIQFNLTLIGLALAMVFNINTIEIVNILSSDPEIRNSMVTLAVATAENEEFQKLIEQQRATQKKNEATKDSVPQTYTDAELESKLDSLFNIYEKLQVDAEKVNNIMGYRPPKKLLVINDSIPADFNKKTLSPDERIIEGSYLVKFPSAYLADRTSKYYYIPKKKKDADDKKKTQVYAKFNFWGFWWANKWGYLITALAISLGAPFWFDLLNKLVRLRSSIQRTPNTNSQNTNPQQGGTQ